MGDLDLRRRCVLEAPLDVFLKQLKAEEVQKVSVKASISH